MKRVILSVILLLLSCTILFADTTVSSNIIKDTVWTKSGSPYMVTKSIDVYPNATLTIEPGVTVNFKDDESSEIVMNVYGTLKAIGTANDMIVFTTNHNSASYRYCEILFKEGSIGTNIDDKGNYISGSIIKYCDLHRCVLYLDYESNTNFYIANNNFQLNGISLQTLGEVTIESNTITNLKYGNYAIICTNANVLNINKNNIINSYDGLYCVASNISINGNIIKDNGTKKDEPVFDGKKYTRNNIITIFSNNALISNNIFSYNNSTSFARPDPSWYFPLSLIRSESEKTSINNNKITNNICNGFISGKGDFTIFNNLISDNSIDKDAINLEQDRCDNYYNIDFYNNTLIQNGIFKCDSDCVKESSITNNIFIKNTDVNLNYSDPSEFNNNIMINNNAFTADFQEFNYNILHNNKHVQVVAQQNNIITNSINSYHIASNNNFINNIIKNNKINNNDNISTSNLSKVIRNKIINGVSDNTKFENNEIINNTYGIGSYDENQWWYGIWLNGHNLYRNNIYNNTNFDLSIRDKEDFTATNNYWGTSDTDEIDSHIIDYWDHIDRGKVIYKPFASEPFRIIVGDKCNSKLFVDYTLYISVLTMDNINYNWILLEYDSTKGKFSLSDFGEGTTQNNYSDCQPASFYFDGINYIMHIPFVTFNESDYWIDLIYIPTSDGKMWFQLADAGIN